MFGRIKKGWSEFREFAFKGNMIDLAIAVVIGGAFSGVIQSLVKDIIMPSVMYVTSATKAATEQVKHGVEVAADKVGLTTQPSTAPSTQASTIPSTLSTGTAVATVVSPLPPVVSTTPGIASKLVFLNQPTDIVAGSPINPPIVVAVEDANGNVLSTNSSPVNLTVGSGSGPLTGTLSAPASGGIAAFGNISSATPGSITLKATDGELKSAVSEKFNVTAAPPPPTNEKAVQLDWKIGNIEIGHFVAELLNFMLIAFAVFFVMVKVLGSVMKRVSKPVGPSEPTTRECPFCLQIIPIKASKCSHCTSEVPAV